MYCISAMTLETRHDFPDEHPKTDTPSSNQDSINKYLHDQDYGGANEVLEQASCDEDMTANVDVAVISPAQAESDLFIKKVGGAPNKGQTSQSLLERLKTDLPFRGRYMHTLCLCWGFIVLVRLLRT